MNELVNCPDLNAIIPQLVWQPGPVVSLQCFGALREEFIYFFKLPGSIKSVNVHLKKSNDLLRGLWSNLQLMCFPKVPSIQSHQFSNHQQESVKRGIWYIYLFLWVFQITEVHKPEETLAPCTFQTLGSSCPRWQLWYSACEQKINKANTQNLPIYFRS